MDERIALDRFMRIALETGLIERALHNLHTMKGKRRTSWEVRVHSENDIEIGVERIREHIDELRRNGWLLEDTYNTIDLYLEKIEGYEDDMDTAKNGIHKLDNFVMFDLGEEYIHMSKKKKHY